MNKMTDLSKQVSASHKRKMDYHAPLSGRLPALERNILKYRALEMILIVFYCDHLKRKIQTVAHRNARFRNSINANPKPAGKQTTPRITTKRSMCVLQDLKLIDEVEATEIRSLIDFRNTIAHEVQKVVSDVGGGAFVRELYRLDIHEPRYAYGTVDRLKHFINVLDIRMQKSGFTLIVSFDFLEFAAAEKTYENELARLKNVIDRQYRKRMQTIRELNDELTLPEAEFGVGHHPRDPENKYANGRLTERGIRMCYLLYDLGKSPMAVALLMEMSLGAAKRRQAQWERHRNGLGRNN